MKYSSVMMVKDQGRHLTLFGSVSIGLLLQSREFEFRAILIPPPSLFVRRKAGVESVVLGCAVDCRARSLVRHVLLFVFDLIFHQIYDCFHPSELFFMLENDSLPNLCIAVQFRSFRGKFR